MYNVNYLIIAQGYMYNVYSGGQYKLSPTNGSRASSHSTIPGPKTNNRTVQGHTCTCTCACTWERGQ